MKLLCLLSSLLAFALALIACKPGPVEAGTPRALAPAASVQAAAQPMQSQLLTIYGYNYTDRYIDSFRVNGQGGGNLFLSGEGGGGGKGTCCVSWWPGTKLPKRVRIDWVSSYCKQRLTSNPGDREWTQPIWKTVHVNIEGPVPSNPGYFEVHISKDGRVEVALTAGPSRPRLILPEGDGKVRPGTTANDPPCPADYDRVRELMRLDEPSQNKPLPEGKPHV
jgi:hypothetical protein